MRAPVPRSRWARALLVLVPALALLVVVWVERRAVGVVVDAFTIVNWAWVFAAIALNLASVLARSLAWKLVIDQAMPPPRPGFRLVFPAFSVGLLANAVLPGRIGELARVAVLTRKSPTQRGAWATLIGTVFAHRVFDLIPVVLLIAYVLAEARIPAWAVTSLTAVVIAGVAVLAFSFAGARRHHRSPLDGLGAVRRLVTMARHGLGVMHAPGAAAGAILLQCVGWLCQLLAVWTAMFAFRIDEPLAAAALVLVLINVATIFPLWPGNIGLVQAAVALPLVSYGIAYPHGFAFGIGLQAIEASVGVGVGLLFLAREGVSFAMLRRMPDAAQAELPDEPPPAVTPEPGSHRARAGVPG